MVFGQELNKLVIEKTNTRNTALDSNAAYDAFQKLPDFAKHEIENLTSYFGGRSIDICFRPAQQEKCNLSNMCGRAGYMKTQHYILPSKWNIELEFDICAGYDDVYCSHDIYFTIPWNYSPFTGQSMDCLIPMILELIEIRHNEMVLSVVEANKSYRLDKAKAKKEKEQNEILLLDSLAKKYKKTLT
jgi:hypothetical protein